MWARKVTQTMCLLVSFVVLPFELYHCSKWPQYDKKIITIGLMLSAGKMNTYFLVYSWLKMVCLYLHGLCLNMAFHFFNLSF